MTHSLLRDSPSSDRSTGVREALLRDFSTGSFVEDAPTDVLFLTSHGFQRRRCITFRAAHKKDYSQLLKEILLHHLVNHDRSNFVLLHHDHRGRSIPCFPQQ